MPIFFKMNIENGGKKMRENPDTQKIVNEKELKDYLAEGGSIKLRRSLFLFESNSKRHFHNI